MTETYQTIDNDFANTAPVEAIDNEIEATEAAIAGKAPASKAPAEKSAAVSEALMRKSMSDTFDRMQAEGEQEAARETIPAVPGTTLDQAFLATADWMAKSEADKAQMTDAHGNAAKFGVELSEADALKLAFANRPCVTLPTG